MPPKTSPTNDPNVGSILKYLAATPTHRTELEIHQPEAKSVESLLQLESAKENTKHEQLKTKRVLREAGEQTKRVLGEAVEQTKQEQDKTKRVLGQAIEQTKQEQEKTAQVIEQTKQEQDKTKRVLGQAVEQTKQEQEKTAQEKERTAQAKEKTKQLRAEASIAIAKSLIPFIGNGVKETVEVLRRPFDDDRNRSGVYVFAEDIVKMALPYDDDLKSRIAVREIYVPTDDCTHRPDEMNGFTGSTYCLDGTPAQSSDDFRDYDGYAVQILQHFVVMARNTALQSLPSSDPCYQHISDRPRDALEFKKQLYMSNTVDLNGEGERMALETILDRHWDDFTFFGIAGDGNCGPYSLSLLAEVLRHPSESLSNKEPNEEPQVPDNSASEKTGDETGDETSDETAEDEGNLPIAIVYRNAPRVALRVAGEIYKKPDGTLAKWDGKQFRKICKENGCDKSVQGSTGFCKAHGGGKRCKAKDCDKSARASTDFCCAHGGGKRCKKKDCDKGAEGSTSFCIKHGGGKRCQKNGCDKSAHGLSGLCIGHGGGKRCKAKDCDKSARGSTDFCFRHGGGMRCKAKDCDKSAIGSTDYCCRHGGGKRCKAKDCDKSAIGSTDYCCRHGGGKRCESAVCAVYEDPRERGYGGYKAPELITDSRGTVEKGTRLCYNCLGSLFPDMVKLKVRQEHLILAEIQRQLPELEPYLVAQDCPIPGSCSLKRPDCLWNLGAGYLHVEVDEGGDVHEDSLDRLHEIQESINGMDGLVVRINPEKLLRKRLHSDGEYKYTGTGNFEEWMKEVCDYIRDKVFPVGEVFECGEDGLFVQKFFF